MIGTDRKAIKEYWKILHSQKTTEAEKKAAKDILKNTLSEDVTRPEVFLRWLCEACQCKDGDALGYVMSIGYSFDLFNEDSVRILKTAALENWHHGMEDMVGLVEQFGGSDRNEVLEKMALQKYPGHYLGEDDEYVTRKCMWALHRLYRDRQDKDALERIKRLSVCGDPMVEGFAQHHLKKLRIME